MEKVKVVIINLNSQEIPIDFPESSILFNISQAGLDWLHACGQKGKCTTCAFQIIEGEQYLSQPTDSELKFMEHGRLKEGFRLACQTKTNGNIMIRVPERLKLPHISYSS